MRKISNKSGFTLTEVLVSLVILSIGMLGLSRMTLGSININALNKNKNIASTLLQDRIENIKRSGYIGATSASSTENYGTLQGYATYKRVTSIAFNTPATNVKTVTVTVFWENDKRSLSATTLLAE